MSEPVRYALEVEKFESLLNHLESALTPRVAFSNDIEAMRKDAEGARVQEIEEAMKLIFTNVPGLRVRPLMEKLNQ